MKLSFMDKQIELRSRTITIVEENVEKLGNDFVKSLLLGVAQDSHKHAALLRSLRRAVEGPHAIHQHVGAGQDGSRDSEAY